MHSGRLVPVYSATEGLPARWLRSLLWRLVSEFAGEVGETLPAALRERRGLVGLSEALRAAYFPETEEARAAAAEAELARLRAQLERPPAG